MDECNVNPWHRWTKSEELAMDYYIQSLCRWIADAYDFSTAPRQNNKHRCWTGKVVQSLANSAVWNRDSTFCSLKTSLVDNLCSGLVASQMTAASKDGFM
jgi:hypothetical protein